MTAQEVKKELRNFVVEGKAPILQRFFKTGKGEYGEGDIFIGVVVPNVRKVAKKFKDIDINELLKLLSSKIHEERLCALFILVLKFEHAKTENEKKSLCDVYLLNNKYINNWDLVDLSAYKILGVYLLDKPRDILYRLAVSDNLWEKRISIISTFAFIKNKETKDTLKIAKLLLEDEHDLIHKAVGWMLRELGKRASLDAEIKFLRAYNKIMPRTMLRYAIEKFPASLKCELMRK